MPLRSCNNGHTQKHARSPWALRLKLPAPSASARMAAPGNSQWSPAYDQKLRFETYIATMSKLEPEKGIPKTDRQRWLTKMCKEAEMWMQEGAHTDKEYSEKY